jgi:purine-binding chemotaxis protein CheW
MSDGRLVCSFRLAEHEFAVEIDRVQEVLKHQEITRLPLAGEAVRGVINLRGVIVPALDLRACLEMGPAPDGVDPANIVVRGPGGQPVSLLVDDIGDVVPIPEGAYERPPETLQGRARELIHGVHQRRDGILLVLDIGKVLRAAYAPAPVTFGRSGRS